MNVSVKNHLAGGVANVAVNIAAKRPNALQNGRNDFFRRVNDCSGVFFASLKEMLGMIFWNELGVTGIERFNVQKSENLIVLVNFMAWNFAGHDFAKKTFRHI